MTLYLVFDALKSKKISMSSKFKVSKRAARVGRNPQTGKELKIPARKAPTFKAGAALKAAVN